MTKLVQQFFSVVGCLLPQPQIRALEPGIEGVIASEGMLQPC